MHQVFIGKSPELDADAFERRLYIIRKRFEKAVHRLGVRDPEYFYFTSMSSRTIVYKGMLVPSQVREYYPDLGDQRFISAMAMFHARFSTNTFPSWRLAHPYRTISHNGEINTLRGNKNWMAARESLFESEALGDTSKYVPVLEELASDTAGLDNALELLTLAGRPIEHAMMMLIPEAWSGHETMSDEKKAFYEYHSLAMEPWDGPASVAFTDGRTIGAVLDRNGLRPSRYIVTKDDMVVMASEVGVLEVPEDRVLYKGRLQPGRMFLVSLDEGRIIDDDELKERYTRAHDYRGWLEQNLVRLEDLPDGEVSAPIAGAELLERRIAFGYTVEDLKYHIGPMARQGQEDLGSMGNDTPLAVLSNRAQPLYNYFKQLFAQVTNPPLDAIREEIVTSVDTLIGPEGNLLQSEPDTAYHQIALKSPFVDNEQIAKLKTLNSGKFRASVLPSRFRPRTARPASSRPCSGSLSKPTRRSQGARTCSCFRTAAPMPNTPRFPRCWPRPDCTITWFAPSRGRRSDL